MIKPRRMRRAVHVARIGKNRNAYGISEHTWVDNIKTDLREIGWDGMD
jgi:hypothetical protein